MFKNLLSKLKTNTINFLKFMRLVGDDNHWDWTTTALAASIFVLMFRVTAPGIGEIATFFIALLARAHKKQIAYKSAQEQAQQSAQMAAQLEAAHAKIASVSAELDRVKTEVGLSNFAVPFGGFTGAR